MKTARDILAAKGSEKWTIKPGATISKVLQIMEGKEAGALVGIVSIGDLVKSIIDEQKDVIEDLKNYSVGKYV